MDQFKEKAKKAFRWTVIARITAQFFTWISSLIVIRFLTPEDFGIVAMVEVVFVFLFQFSSAGMGDGVIQKSNLDKGFIKKILGLLIVINLFLALAQVLFAPYAAIYFNEPDIENILILTALIYVFMPWIIMPYSILSRQLKFKGRSLIDLFSALFGAALSLTLAYNGFGYWSLIFSMMLVYLLKFLGYNIISPTNFLPSFSFKDMGGIFKFGSVVTITSLVWSLYLKVDILIGGYYLDAKAIGYYAVAVHISQLPMTKVIPLINQITFPLYSSIKENKDQINKYLLYSIRVASFVSFPLFLGIASVAPEAISVVLGAEWSDASIPLMILCLTIPFRVLMNIFTPANKALGKPEIGLYHATYTLVVLTIAVFIAARFGIVALAIAWLVVTPLYFTFAIAISTKALKMKKTSVLKAFFPCLLVSMLMAIAVKIMNYYIESLVSDVFQLLCEVILGIIIYTGFMYVFERKRFAEVASIRI